MAWSSRLPHRTVPAPAPQPEPAPTLRPRPPDCRSGPRCAVPTPARRVPPHLPLGRRLSRGESPGRAQSRPHASRGHRVATLELWAGPTRRPLRLGRCLQHSSRRSRLRHRGCSARASQSVIPSEDGSGRGARRPRVGGGVRSGAAGRLQRAPPGQAALLAAGGGAAASERVTESGRAGAARGRRRPTASLASAHAAWRGDTRTPAAESGEGAEPAERRIPARCESPGQEGTRAAGR